MQKFYREFDQNTMYIETAAGNTEPQGQVEIKSD